MIKLNNGMSIHSDRRTYLSDLLEDSEGNLVASIHSDLDTGESFCIDIYEDMPEWGWVAPTELYFTYTSFKTKHVTIRANYLGLMKAKCK